MEHLNNWSSFSLVSFVSLIFYCSNPLAGTVGSIDPASRSGLYLGAFGGGGYSDNDEIGQDGVALYNDSHGGPFSVSANGVDRSSVGVAGAHIGYEWKEYSFGGGELIPAAEFEGLYLGSTQSGNLFHPNNRVIGHTFEDNFPIEIGIYLTNAVFSYRSPRLGRFEPYIGGGVGAARVFISNANSAQVITPEPGINHFNGKPNAADWTFAGQAKVGLRYALNEHWRLFGEYRLIQIGNSNYVFGPTIYPTHAPTSLWNVHFANMYFDTGVAGIQYVS